MNAIESRKIQVAAIHQINGSGLPDQLIEDIDFVNLAACDDDHRGNAAAQVEQRMQLDGGLASAELSPRKKRQTQIDSGRIQRIDGLSEFQAEGFVDDKERALWISVWAKSA